ncbi:MAG: tetratricopeptide repeat protein [Alphaproteobacteria bacterium]|nr:tetratricopeptide repeat protein [Alphaproteobacteria bacterium]
MRAHLRLLCTVSLLALAACDGTMETTKGPVDPATLGPLPARELLAIESGNQSLRAGQTAQAEASYRSAIALSKGHVDAHIMLARLLANQGRAAEAQKIVQEGLSWQPEQPDLNLMLGKYLLSQGYYTEAQRVFENGLIAMPRNIDLLAGKGIAMDMQGDHIGAQLAYKEALTYNPREQASFVQNNLGLSYLFNNEAKEAVSLLEPLAKEKDASAVTIHNLALAYTLLKEEKKAQEILGDDYDADKQKEALESLEAYYAAKKKGDEAATPPSLPVQASE